MKTFKCLVCGYIVVGETPPLKCPVCGAPAEDFEEVIGKTTIDGQDDAIGSITDVQQVTEQMRTSWRCLNCEYTQESENPPAVCPVCGVSKDLFEENKQGSTIETIQNNRRIVIIGSGIAGIACAEELRSHSKDIDIQIITNDQELPYYRLNLTRYLAQETSRESLPMYDANWYVSNKIDLKRGQEVARIDRDTKKVQLETGEWVAYDQLVIACGAHPFVPPIPGTTLENVVTVREIKDAEHILKTMKPKEPCVCIGGGILGLETAAAIAKNGIPVTLLEGSKWLMPRQLNEKAGKILKKYVNDLDVTIVENMKVLEIVGNKACEGVRIAVQNGTELPEERTLSAGLVIIAAGVRPNTYLARKTGLEVNNGLVVDNYLRTSDEWIYAAGDVTEHYGMVYGLWNVAQYQGKIAAQNILGMKSQFGGVPRSNVMKVLGIDLFSIGEFTPVDGSYECYESSSESSYMLLVLRDEKITGSIVIGHKALSLKIKQAVEKGTHFSTEIASSLSRIVDELMK